MRPIPAPVYSVGSPGAVSRSDGRISLSAGEAQPCNVCLHLERPAPAAELRNNALWTATIRGKYLYPHSIPNCYRYLFESQQNGMNRHQTALKGLSCRGRLATQLAFLDRLGRRN